MVAKNIVLCLDGTGNQVKAKGNTNVLRLYEMLDLSDPARQVAFYDPGVGTFSAPGAWTPLSGRFTRLLGLAFGYGIKTNLEEAYAYLIRNFEPGDSVFVFGFSRGAFTARGLAGLTHRAGLMRPGAENLVPYLVRAYTKGDDWSDDDWKKVDRFARTFSRVHGRSRSLPLHFMGLWDSVKALGYFRFDPKWPYTRQLPNAAAIRHAVSIDERRRPYREYLVENENQDVLTEAWFAGVHSDVGGGFMSQIELAEIALKWMVDGALDRGLLLAPGAYRRMCSLSAEHAAGASHRAGWVWGLLGYRTRRIVPADARIHQSVKQRMSSVHGYEIPAGLSTVRWEDPEWTEPHPGAP